MARTREALNLPRSPLVMVLAQVRFSAVVKIIDYIPEVQERVRKNGFPRFSEGRVREVLIGPDGPAKVREHPRWEFQDKDQRTGIIVSQNGVVLHTNSYETFDEFTKALKLAVTTVGDVIQPSLVERLGLRYVDLISPRQDERWQDYLQEGLHGLDPTAIGMQSGTHRTETLGETALGRLVVRTMQTRDGTFLPPDLSPSTLDYTHLPNEGFRTLLDLDHYSEETRSYDAGAVLKSFWDLHDSLDLSFREATTEHAMAAWNAKGG